MNINVLISAYNTSNIINNTIYSILNQNIENLKIYVGIDGDDESYPKIQNVNYYKSLENVGTYIILNSLSKLINNDDDFMLFFDSDDIMSENFLIPYIKKCKNIDMDKNILRLNFKNNGKGKIIFGYKTILIKNKIFKNLNGYYDFRVSQDDVLLWRLKKKNIGIIQDPKLPCFYRTIREDALTQNKKTGYNSQYRKNIVSKSKHMLNNNIDSSYKITKLIKYE